MKKYQGKSVFGGIAVGHIACLKKEEQQVKRTRIENPEQELARFEEARKKAVEQLKGLYEKALKEVGEANAAIFEAHQMMLEDEDYLASIKNIVENQRVNAEYAVASTEDMFASMFASMEDDYMKARAADIRDISERVIAILSGSVREETPDYDDLIIVAEDLTPSETVSLDKKKVRAFVTVKGSLNSHTAILARTMNIPALIGTPIPLDDDLHGKQAVVDGFTGTIYVEPEEKLLAQKRADQEEERRKKELLQLLKGKENVTLDGQKIQLYANITDTADLALALENDAAGIGLFRSEFLYLGRATPPTEEEQFEIYKRAVLAMGGKKVIIRTMDIGADKQAPYFDMEPEENPALGYRAIRICLTRTEIFKTQLRALFRAAAYGNLSIMYPMITSPGEVKKIQTIVAEVKEELKDQQIAFGEAEQGIMIETPAAAIISDLLAGEVDFFSIGTNDLTQYCLAIDRQNPLLDEFYDAHHKAVLRMIKRVTDNAHAAGIWAGICGELGADLELIPLFLAMGVDELSVSPGRILSVRDAVRQCDVGKEKDRLLKTYL